MFETLAPAWSSSCWIIDCITTLPSFLPWLLLLFFLDLDLNLISLFLIYLTYPTSTISAAVLMSLLHHRNKKTDGRSKQTLFTAETNLKKMNIEQKTDTQTVLEVSVSCWKKSSIQHISGPAAHLVHHHHHRRRRLGCYKGFAAPSLDSLSASSLPR